jgi:uncharacterized protein (TIGR01777 family)
MNQTTSEKVAKVVIAGGSGFIGRRLAALLAANGTRVIVLTRSNIPADVGNVSFVQWDGATPGDWCRHLESAAAVVNLCGDSIAGKRWSDARKRELLDSRTIPTAALVAACNESISPPKILLQASGVGYYGIGNKECTETSGAGSDFLADLANAWERPLKNLTTRSVTMRLGVVLGKTGGALPQMLLPFRFFAGGPIASGNQWLSWIHLSDAVAAMVFFIDHDEATGPYNLVAPNPVRNHTFAQLSGKMLHRPSWLPTPRFVMKALLGEQATLLCDGQPAIPEKLLKTSFAFRYPTLEEALQELTN